MNAIEKLVAGIMKDKGISRGSMAKLMGRKNSNKVLRHLDELLATGTADGDFVNDLQRILEIPCTQFVSACRDSFLEVKEEQLPGPHIHLLSRKLFGSFITATWLQPLHAISVTPSLAEKNLDEECSAIQSLVQHRLDEKTKELEHRDIYGYLYFRAFDQTLEFDMRGSLVNCRRRDPYSAPRLVV